MTQTGHPQPEQLARELKVVLRAGTRPAKLVHQLDRLPGLIVACALATPDDQPWDQAISVCQAAEQMTADLGNGVYGQAAQALFGTSSETRGLLLGRRRLAAADLLQVEVATVERHWEDKIILDLAVAVYQMSITS